VPDRPDIFWPHGFAEASHGPAIAVEPAQEQIRSPACLGLASTFKHRRRDARGGSGGLPAGVTPAAELGRNDGGVRLGVSHAASGDGGAGL
jgi:hypothetical protein